VKSINRRGRKVEITQRSQRRTYTEVHREKQRFTEFKKSRKKKLLKVPPGGFRGKKSKNLHRGSQIWLEKIPSSESLSRLGGRQGVGLSKRIHICVCV
jgi:hypothetical protein